VISIASNPFQDVVDLIGYCPLNGEFISTDSASEPLESFYISEYLRLAAVADTRRINVCGDDYLGVSFNINRPSNIISIASKLPSLISEYRDTPIQAHLLRVASDSNKYRAKEEVRILFEMLRMDFEAMKLGGPQNPWDLILGPQQAIAEKEASGAIDTWKEYLTVQESITFFRLAVCRYEALAEVHHFERDEADSEYEVPTSIDGKKVYGIEGDFVVGGELQCWDERYIDIPWGYITAAISWVSRMGFKEFYDRDFSLRNFIAKGSTLNAYCPGGTEIDCHDKIAQITAKGINGNLRYYLGRQTDRATGLSHELWIEPVDDGASCAIYETREFDNASARFPNEEPTCEVTRVGVFNIEEARHFFAFRHFVVRSAIWDLCYRGNR